MELLPLCAAEIKGNVPDLFLELFARTFGEGNVLSASVIEPGLMRVNHPRTDDNIDDGWHHRKKFSSVSSACHRR